MIECKEIKKSYGGLHVLKGISLAIRPAEVVSIVGASGAGKSTLLQIMGSLLYPDSGHVMIDGVDIFSLPSDKLAVFRNRKIGFVFQFHHLLPEFTALENVMMPALIARSNAGKKIEGQPESWLQSDKKIRARANELLADLGIGDRAGHKPAQMSGGEQQRVAVARALINNPAVLFADEPSGNLDSKNKEELHRLFFDLREKYGQTVVIVTHEKELAQMCDRCLEMKDGQFQI